MNLYAYCFANPVNWMDPRGLCAVEKGIDLAKDISNDVLDWWNDVAITTGEYWGDKAQDAWGWLQSLNGVHEYKESVFGNESLGLFNVNAKSKIDLSAGTLQPSIQASVAQAVWEKSKGNLSNVTGLYHWNAEAAAGSTNYTLHAKLKGAAFEGKTASTLRIGKFYVKGEIEGTLGSLGAEGKIGLKGVKLGFHLIVGAAVGVEWGTIR